LDWTSTNVLKCCVSQKPKPKQQVVIWPLLPLLDSSLCDVRVLSGCGHAGDSVGLPLNPSGMCCHCSEDSVSFFAFGCTPNVIFLVPLYPCLRVELPTLPWTPSCSHPQTLWLLPEILYTLKTCELNQETHLDPQGEERDSLKHS
jgi:hypothetical protein